MPTTTTAARTFLKTNGVFSLLAAGTVAPVLFADSVDWATWGLRGFGVGLIGFGGLAYALSKYKFVSRNMVNDILALDLLWVIFSIILIAFFGHVLKTSGTVIIEKAAAWRDGTSTELAQAVNSLGDLPMTVLVAGDYPDEVVEPCCRPLISRSASRS